MIIEVLSPGFRRAFGGIAISSASRSMQIHAVAGT
jgi:hypothetical protein